jgi:hypothetical protein
MVWGSIKHFAVKRNCRVRKGAFQFSLRTVKIAKNAKLQLKPDRRV